METIHTDVVVIGAGPGGYTAAFLAADMGKKVTLIDTNAKPGGVCLHRGCIPTKALLHICKVKQDALKLAQFGMSFTAPQIDFDRVREWKGEVIDRLTGGLMQLSKARNIRYIQGSGAFASSQQLIVSEGDVAGYEINFSQAIIATGTTARKLPFLDYNSSRIWESKQALELPFIPQKLLLIGGGYIGLEMGYIFQSLGAQTTIVEMGNTIMPSMDKELTRIFEHHNKDFFASIEKSTKVVAVHEDDKGLRVELENAKGDKKVEQYDAILVAIGQEPDTSKLGLENTEVLLTDKGFIKVDEKQCTADGSIYGIGDIVGGALLAHKASYEARIAAEVIAGKKSAYDAKVIPSVVYTDPELATVGLMEAEAKSLGIDYKVAKFPWSASGRAIAMGESTGLTKLIIDKSTERILGAAIVGKNAGDLISEMALAIELSATASDIELTIHPHPTLSETIMESAENFYGISTHLFQKVR